MSSRYGPTKELLEAIDLLSGFAGTALRLSGRPRSRGLAFREMLSYRQVINLLGHGHPFLKDAEKLLLAGSDGDSGIRAVAAWLVDRRDEFSSPTPPAGTTLLPPALSAAPQKAKAAAPKEAAAAAAPARGAVTQREARLSRDLPRAINSRDPRLRYIGIVRWRLYVAVPLRSWCTPFAWVWRSLVVRPITAAWRARLPRMSDRVGRIIEGVIAGAILLVLVALISRLL